MQKLDGIYRVFNSPTARKHVRRFSFIVALLVIISGLASDALTPKSSLGETGTVSSNRIWSSGAELQSTVEYTNQIGAASGISTSIKHAGAASYQFNYTSTSGINTKTFSTTLVNGKYWFRFYFYIGTMGTAASNIIFCTQDTANSLSRVCIRLLSSKKLQLSNERGSGSVTGNTVLSTSTWYRIEMALDDTTTASSTARLRLNGVTEATTGTINTGTAGFNQIFWGTGSSDTVNYYFDDIAMNGNTGRGDNWPGDGYIVHIAPGAAGDNTTWTTTGTCTGGNYACTNETIPNTTNYVSTTTNGNTDDYKLAAFSGAGITAGDQIKLVSVGTYATSSCTGTLSFCTNTGGTSTINLRLKAASGGTVSSVSTSFNSIDGFVTNADDATNLYPLTAYTTPGTNVNWTTTNLTNSQIGVNKVSSTAGAPRVSTLWALVEYAPASGGRIWSSGFEQNTTTANVEWTSATGSPTIQTSTVRSGTYAMQTAGSGAQSYMSETFQAANANGPFFFRAYLDIGTGNSGEYSIMELQDSTNTRQVWVTLTSTNKLRLYSTSSSGAQIGSDSSTLYPGNWYRVEVKFDRSPAGGSQVAALQLNGSSVATSSALTITNGITQLALGNNIGNVGSPTTGQMYYDDVAINQNLGTTQNSYPGDGRIVMVQPNAAGDNSGWTKNGAGCTGGSNYQCVNEVTPDDATTYVSTSTNNTIDDYAVASTGVNSSATITMVEVGVRFRTSASTEGDFRLRLKDASGAVPIESTNINPASSTWVSNATASPYNYTMTAYTRPEQSTAWTKATLDTAQIGIRSVNSTSGVIQVSNIWMLVEYTPQTISISGTLYQTDESTVISTTPTVAVKVNGAGSYTTTAAANGTYTVSSIVSQAGDAIAVYISGATPKGVTYTISSGANLTSFNVYQDRITTRCDNSCSLANTAINYYNGNQNSDIHATTTASVSTSSQLTVNNDWKLLIVANTFAPGDTVTTATGGSNTYSGDVEIKSGATLNMAGNALSISGNYTNSGTFTSGSNTTTFTATTTGKTIAGTLTSGSAFYNLVFNGSGGGWSNSAAMTVSNNLTITAGTLTGSNGITVNGNWSQTGTFTPSTGTVTLAGSGQQTVSKTSGSNTFYNLTITNNSGTADPGCGTSFTPGVVFSNGVTVSNNYTITTASVKVQYNSGSTYTIANINWNGQASGTRIQFRNSNLSSGTWLLAVSGTQTAVSYVNVGRSDASGGSTIIASDGTNADCNNNTNWSFNSNQSPNSPTSLVQKRTTAGTTMSVGDWTNETKVTMTASASDPDASDTLYLCVEVVPIASSFTNTETGCGAGVSYTGSPVTVTYNNTTLSDATEYKWQARLKDAAGAYSSWVDYGSNGASRDFGVDTTAPSTGTVYDGTTTNVESSYNDGSLTAISANWSGFSATVSGLNYYEYSVGTSAGDTSLVNWTNNSTTTSVTASGLNLHTNQYYYFNVRATDNAGNVSSVVSSSGQQVLPQLTFSLGSSSISFSNLNSSNNLQDTKSLTVTTSTNAYGGYVISQYAGGLLTNGSVTIPMFSAGSYASPASWGSGLCSGSSCGFGYTSSDTTINGSNKFGSATLYAPFSQTAPGDVVADHTAAINGTSGAVSNESFTITCKLAVSKLQQSTTYTGTIYYIATGTF